ncbi:hypothetical protein RhiLY_09140 [Ceratobasidium sp. AG-Ba]|nr:hypothetical protein RhiLY_09140 [Ceratobasidium sp. AG-Ba]
MSKRKNVAGYIDSSDDECSVADSKQAKSASYAPPRVTTASRPATVGFQLPGLFAGFPRVSAPPSRQASVSSTSSRLTPVPNAIQTACRTPKIHQGNVHFGTLPIVQFTYLAILGPTHGSKGDVPGPAGLPVEPADSTVSNTPQAAVHSSSGPSVGSNSNASRSTLAMERQMNEMNDGLQDLKRTSEQRQMATDSTLAQILNAIQRLESASTPSPTGFTSSTPPDEKHDLSGLGITTGLAMMMSRVVSGSRSRVGKKKGGEHTRTTLYGLAKIRSANDVQPYYEDEYGQPNTLPEAYFDRATGQGRVFPHWKAPLNKQLAWLPYYLRRFKATIPHDNSELSEALRALRDEEILILLNDGAFKTCCAAWHTITLNKTKDKIEAMKSNARRYQRTERKAISRGGRIKAEIPSVQGPGWEYLSHPKYMSQDESDNDGILTTKRPEYRAKWITNLFEAMDVLERERPRPKHQALAHRVEIVKRPIPHLEHASVKKNLQNLI